MQKLFNWLHQLVFFVVVGIGLSLPAQWSIAGELYPSGSARAFTQFDALESDATVGGYPVFQGGAAWRIISLKADKNNLGNNITYTYLISPVRDGYFAEMGVTVSLAGGENVSRQYFSADPCGGAVQALVKVNKGAGTSDNCLTIKPLAVTILGKSKSVFELKIRNSQYGARLYDIQLLLAMDKLGFADTYEADWSAAAVASNPERKQFLEKLTAFAGKLQDGVQQALGYSKPLDAFVNVPAIETLLAPAPAITTTHSPSNSYAWCESLKKMMPDDAKGCPPGESVQ